MYFWVGFSHFLFIFSAISLVLIVLFQDEQGNGLGGAFAGTSDTIFGVAGISILQKVTAILGSIFFLSAIAYGLFSRLQQHGLSDKDLKQISQNFKEVSHPENPEYDSTIVRWWEEKNLNKSQSMNILTKVN